MASAPHPPRHGPRQDLGHRARGRHASESESDRLSPVDGLHVPKLSMPSVAWDVSESSPTRRPGPSPSPEDGARVGLGFQSDWGLGTEASKLL